MPSSRDHANAGLKRTLVDLYNVDPSASTFSCSSDAVEDGGDEIADTGLVVGVGRVVVAVGDD